MVGHDTCIIDPAVETALTVKKILQQRSLINIQSAENSTYVFQVTDSPERFAHVAGKFLISPISTEQVKNVSFNDQILF